MVLPCRAYSTLAAGDDDLMFDLAPRVNFACDCFAAIPAGAGALMSACLAIFIILRHRKPSI